MASLNLGQDVANERERKWTAAHIVAKILSPMPSIRMDRYGSLIKINPSRRAKASFFRTVSSCDKSVSSVRTNEFK